jgi:probable F420-dependent oxidoreductase
MEYWLGIFHEGNEQLKALARAAEQMGFAGIALPDHVAIPQDYASEHPSGRRHIEHHSRFPDVMVSAATILAVTSRLRVMSYVYILPMREPLGVAKQVSTLAMQSDYRFAFGAGAGWNAEEFKLLGQDFHTRGARMDEQLAILRHLWENGEATFDGRYYGFGPIGQYPVPERHIPVWIGGKSAAALARAARHDGWLGMNYPMEEIGSLLEQLNEQRQRHVDSGGADHGEFRRFVSPLAEPSAEIYERLGRWGVDGTVVMAWAVDEPASATLDAKLDAMHRFAHAHFH